MSQLIGYFWLITDAVWAALTSLNIVPVIIISALIGIIQSKRSHYALKALLCLALALVVDGLWPLSFGGGVVIPAIGEPEVQIQMALLFVIAYMTLRLMCVVKNTMSLTPVPKSDELP